VFNALCAGLLCACAAPDYQPVSSAEVARIRFVNAAGPHICRSGTAFFLRPDSSGYASVPAGHPVQFRARFRQGSGVCYPRVKFTPQTGQVYDIVTEARAEHCVTTVMLHDASAQYGIRLEPSTTQPREKCE
jgi:hypothetical protein